MSAAASYWRNAVRHPEDCGIGNIRRTFDYTEFGNLAGEYPAYALPIGCLEKGAVPLRISTRVQTAVTGGTPAVTIGTSTDPDAFAIAADIAAGSTGYKTAATGAEMGKALAADTMFFAYISASAVTGKFTMTVEFANRRESIPFREDATDAGDEEEGGGEEGGLEELAFADFVNGVYRVNGVTTDPAVMVGDDPNTNSSYVNTLAYSADNILAGDGYDLFQPFAFIGDLRTMLQAGATIVCRFKTDGAGNVFFSTCPNSSISDFTGIESKLKFGLSGAGTTGAVRTFSWDGDLVTSTATDLDLASGAINVVAITLVSDRIDVACNGGTAVTGVIGADEVEPGKPFISFLVYRTTMTAYVQSITIYDPLPSTAGLSELSEP